jgi:hypothetical protein
MLSPSKILFLKINFNRKPRSQGFDCENSRFHEIFNVEFVGEEGLVFRKKSARMLILSLAAMDEASEAVRKIESSSRYEFR